MKHIYENIKSLRQQKGLSQEDMAEALSMHQGNYNRLERGQTSLTVDRLILIASLLDVHPKDLLTDDQPTETLDRAKLAKDIEEIKEENDTLAIKLFQSEHLLTQYADQGKSIKKSKEWANERIAPVLKEVLAESKRLSKIRNISSEEFDKTVAQPLNQLLTQVNDLIDTLIPAAENGDPNNPCWKMLKEALVTIGYLANRQNYIK